MPPAAQTPKIPDPGVPDGGGGSCARAPEFASSSRHFVVLGKLLMSSLPKVVTAMATTKTTATATGKSNKMWLPESLQKQQWHTIAEAAAA